MQIRTNMNVDQISKMTHRFIDVISWQVFLNVLYNVIIELILSPSNYTVMQHGERLVLLCLDSQRTLLPL